MKELLPHHIFNILTGQDQLYSIIFIYIKSVTLILMPEDRMDVPAWMGTAPH